MASAAAKVFGIAELLEHILTQHTISVQDLYTLQRLNRFTQQVIETSPQLQTRMYLKPDENYNIKSARVLHPFLKGLHCDKFETCWSGISKKGDVIWFRVKTNSRCATEATDKASIHLPGYIRRHSTEGSWTKMRLSPVNGPVTVTFLTFQRDKFNEVELDANDATFGSLVRVLEQQMSQMRLAS